MCAKFFYLTVKHCRYLHQNMSRTRPGHLHTVFVKPESMGFWETISARKFFWKSDQSKSFPASKNCDFLHFLYGRPPWRPPRGLKIARIDSTYSILERVRSHIPTFHLVPFLSYKHFLRTEYAVFTFSIGQNFKIP